MDTLLQRAGFEWSLYNPTHYYNAAGNVADPAVPASRTRLLIVDAHAPCWAICLTPAIPLSVFLTRLVRGGRCRRLGLCPCCGYDLRATSDRCPECGFVMHLGAKTARPFGSVLWLSAAAALLAAYAFAVLRPDTTLALTPNAITAFDPEHWLNRSYYDWPSELTPEQRKQIIRLKYQRRQEELTRRRDEAESAKRNQ